MNFVFPQEHCSLQCYLTAFHWETTGYFCEKRHKNGKEPHCEKNPTLKLLYMRLIHRTPTTYSNRAGGIGGAVLARLVSHRALSPVVVMLKVIILCVKPPSPTPSFSPS